jgi:hypothetical protein
VRSGGEGRDAYDNAGEHFQPGIDVVEQPGAQHVASAAAILFLFDPFNASEFRRLIPNTKDPQIEKPVLDEQDLILAEMRARIHSLRNLRVGEKITTPVAFVLGKCDAWIHLLDGPLLDPVQDGRLNEAALASNSERLRLLLHGVCPASVANVEGLSENVLFFAASSFGHTPVKLPANEKYREPRYVPDPAKLAPMFVEAPLLWIISQLCPGLIRIQNHGTANAKQFR